MSLTEFAALAVGGPVVLYTIARIIFLAYFTTKQQHERNQNGTQQKSR